MCRWWPSPSFGQSHLHDTNHHYCKLSHHAHSHSHTHTHMRACAHAHIHFMASCLPHMYTVKQKSSGLKFHTSRSGSDMMYSWHQNSSCFTSPTFDVHVTVHRRHSEGKEPTRGNEVCSFYCRNMFRAPICPSSVVQLVNIFCF
jgi:hypothetical protein